MHNYNNSYLDNFRNTIRTGTISDRQNQPAPASIGGGASVQQTEMPNVTPDFGVNIPVGYSKLGTEKLSNGQEIHCYKLNNGQKVFIAPKESAMTVLNTYVNTGSLNEKDGERGISHFCEHMAFNGTKGTNGYMKLGIGDVFRKVGNMGGCTNASTNFAETNYTISIPQFNKDDFETIVKMQSSMMNNLEMSDQMTEKEHGPVTSEINMYSDIPESVVSNVAIKNLYQIKTTSDDIVAGTVNNILNVDSKKVMDYYKNNYFPANMVTVVTGNVNPDEAIDIIAKNFRGENPNNPDRRVEPLNPIQQTVRKDILSPKAVGTTGVLCFNGPANNNAKDNIAILAVNHMLFNKKHSKVSEALEPYHVEVNATSDKIRTNPDDGTLLSLTYTTTEQNSEVALKSVYDMINNFKAPTPEEMETLKAGLKMRYEKHYENMDRLNYMIGQNALNGNLEQCTDAVKIVDSLTPQDLVNAVHKYYDLNKTSIAVIHPVTSDTNTLNNNHNNAKSISFTGRAGVNDSKVSKKPINTDSLERYTLPNNCEVALTESNNGIAAYSMYINHPIPANTKPGVMEILEDLLLKASDEEVKMVDKNNITAYAGATNSFAYYEAELPAQNMTTSLRLMKKFMFNPDLTPERFEKAKNDIRTELSTELPTAYENMKSTLYPNSPRGYSKKDVLNNLDNVTLEDVMGLHKYLMDNGAITFVASVPLSKYPEIRGVINSELSTIKPSVQNQPRVFNDFTPNKKATVITDVANTAQADVVEAFKFKMSHNPKDIATYDLMNSILSSGDETGLFNNLREKEKLAYSVYSHIDYSSTNTATLMCNILTTTDSPDLKSYENVQRSINGFNTQINKMVNGSFTDKELETAKTNLKSSLLQSTDTQSTKVSTLSNGMRTTNGIDEFNQIYEQVDNITKEDIMRVAGEIFYNKPVYSVRASKATLEANKEFFESLER